MDFLCEMLENISEHPPEYLILGAVHMDRKSVGAKGRRPQGRPEELAAGLQSLLSGPEAMPHGTVSKGKEMPPHLLAMAEWADGEMARMKPQPRA